MDPVNYTEDPRTGCWTSEDSPEAVLAFYRDRVGSPVTGLVPVCGTDECVRPTHVRPVFHVESVAEIAAEVFDMPAELLVIPENPSTPEPAPVPQAPVKRGPGRPRKQR